MTLEELIEQQLSLGKKLGEFKVKRKGFSYTYTPYFKDNLNFWHGVDDDNDYRSFGGSSFEDWHLYTEPKVKKKYWQWQVRDDDGWFQTSSFLDESGKTTGSYKRFHEWENLEKRKVEDAFIEIEVEE